MPQRLFDGKAVSKVQVSRIDPSRISASPREMELCSPSTPLRNPGWRSTRRRPPSRALPGEPRVPSACRSFRVWLGCRRHSQNLALGASCCERNAAEEPKATRLHEMPEVQLERVAVRLAYLRSRSQCQPTVIAHELEQPLVER